MRTIFRPALRNLMTDPGFTAHEWPQGTVTAQNCTATPVAPPPGVGYPASLRIDATTPGVDGSYHRALVIPPNTPTIDGTIRVMPYIGVYNPTTDPVTYQAFMGSGPSYLPALEPGKSASWRNVDLEELAPDAPDAARTLYLGVRIAGASVGRSLIVTKGGLVIGQDVGGPLADVPQVLSGGVIASDCRWIDAPHGMAERRAVLYRIPDPVRRGRVLGRSPRVTGIMIGPHLGEWPGDAGWLRS